MHHLENRSPMIQINAMINLSHTIRFHIMAMVESPAHASSYTMFLVFET